MKSYTLQELCSAYISESDDKQTHTHFFIDLWSTGGGFCGNKQMPFPKDHKDCEYCHPPVDMKRIEVVKEAKR